MNLNKVFIAGNLTRDPQVKHTPGGTAVAELGLAVNRTWYDKQAAQKKEEVTFVDVTLWAREAEVAGEFLTKGKSVFIEGRLQLDSFEDKQTGQKRTKMKVVCEHMQMLGSGGKGNSGQSRDEQNQSRSGEESQEPPTKWAETKSEGGGPGPSDEVPFAASR